MLSAGTLPKALGALEGTEFRGRLLQALNDSDYRVAREGIQSVRRIVAREGFQPLYLPHLISLLQNSRLKHDARETIVVYGAEAVPALVHFMKDPGESILVRRALPKALARIGGEESITALIDALAEAEDAALRAQLVEALAMRREDVLRCGGENKIRRAIVAEARRSLRRLGGLRALGAGSSLYFDGPLVRWDARELSLLTQMVAERIEEHLETMFGLLALLFRPKDVWAAHRSLISGRRDLRAGALEYLENTLPHDLRRHVFAAIGDAPVEEKLRLGEKLFGLSPLNASDRRKLKTKIKELSDGCLKSGDCYGAGAGPTSSLPAAPRRQWLAERIREKLPNFVFNLGLKSATIQPPNVSPTGGSTRAI